MIVTENLEEKAFKIADHYGEDAQVDMLIEEMSELTKALLKNRRAKKSGQPILGILEPTTLNIIEELADVEIMLQQIIYLGDFEDDVKEVMKEKLDRQLERIKKEQQN